MTKFWPRLRSQPLTRRERRFLRTGAVVLFITLLLVYVQIPLWNRRDRGRTRLELAQARLDTALAARDRLPALRADVSLLEAEAARAEAGLPAGQDESGFIRGLAGLAAAAGVEVRELTPGEPAAAEGVTAFPFHLTAAASPEAARRFLQGLEEMDRLVQVRSFQYQSGVLTLEGSYFAAVARGVTP
ncbi:MAG: type 4a pilus biogenesis protein PilO [Bacillota bacterium]